jgi:agmatinase
MNERRPNFGDLPEQKARENNSAVTILPVPYDGTSTWIKGAENGPTAIIEASANMELYDIETDSEVYLKGIYTDKPVKENQSPEKMVEAVSKRVNAHLEKKKFVVLLGGEHSVSVGSIQAHARKYENLSILQLDAHSDMREEYNGSKYNHACAMARAKENASVVQVGIRSMEASEKDNMDLDKVFFAHMIYPETDWDQQVTNRLTENVYITIDLDVFDTSIMPSTGTPEPGGMGWYHVLKLLKTVTENKNLVGFDVVELCPNYNNKAPDFLAAKLIYKLLSYKFRDSK